MRSIVDCVMIFKGRGLKMGVFVGGGGGGVDLDLDFKNFWDGSTALRLGSIILTRARFIRGARARNYYVTQIQIQLAIAKYPASSTLQVCKSLSPRLVYNFLVFQLYASVFCILYQCARVTVSMQRNCVAW